MFREKKGGVSRDSLSSTGALRSLTTPTFFSLAPLQMSDSSAPLPLDSEACSLGGVVLACKGDTRSELTQLGHSGSDRDDGKGQRNTYQAEGGGRRRPRGRGWRGRNGHPDPRLARLSVGWRLPTSPSPLGRHDTRQRLLRRQQSPFSIGIGTV